jgi:hypothetical protein
MGHPVGSTRQDEISVSAFVAPMVIDSDDSSRMIARTTTHNPLRLEF